MAIVKEFFDGNTKVRFDDSCYKDKTPEEIEKIWDSVCKTAYEIQLKYEMKKQGILNDF